MNNEVGLEIIETVKIWEDDATPVITLPRESLEKAGPTSAEYAIIATNGRSLFLVPSTTESIREAIEVDEGSRNIRSTSERVHNGTEMERRPSLVLSL